MMTWREPYSRAIQQDYVLYHNVCFTFRCMQYAVNICMLYVFCVVFQPIFVPRVKPSYLAVKVRLKNCTPSAGHSCCWRSFEIFKIHHHDHCKYFWYSVTQQCIADTYSATCTRRQICYLSQRNNPWIVHGHSFNTVSILCFYVI